MPFNREKSSMIGFSTAAFYAKRKQSNVLKLLEERKCEPRILYTVKLIYKYERCRQIIVNMQGLQGTVPVSPSSEIY